MDVEENETSAALVSVLSKMVNPDKYATIMEWPVNKVSDKIFQDYRVDLSRKTPEEGEGLMLVTM